MKDELGEGLRRHRKQRGLSLRSMASAVGISASMLSQVETGKLHPSVPKLFEIAAFLEVSVDALLGLPSTERQGEPRDSMNSALQRKADIPRIVIQDGVTWERLAGTDDGEFVPLIVTYLPGASSSTDGKLIRHSGIELGYMLSGKLAFGLEFETTEIRAGDSFQFDAARPHVFTNESDVTAKGIWFVVRNAAAAPEMSAATLNADERVAKALRALQSGA